MNMNTSKAYVCDTLEDYTSEDTGCPFPYVNKGYADESAFVEGDCSLTYADIHGSPYDVKCAVYMVIFFIPMILLSFYFYKLTATKKKPKAGQKAKLNVMQKTYLCAIIMCVCNVIKSADIDYHGHRINITFLSFIQGVGLASLLNMLVIMSTSWISMIVGGKRAETPTWLRNYGLFSRFYFTLMECSISVIEYHVGEAADIVGAYDGTANGLKNITVGLLLLTWAGLSIWYGSHIQKMLSGGGTSTSEAKKIGNLCVAIGVCSMLGFGYKVLSIFRLGKTMYEPPACEVSMVNILGMLFGFISWYITLLVRPTQKKIAKLNKTTSTTTSSVAPE